METVEPITVHEAKRLVKQALSDRRLSFTRLTARTIDFTDLARCQRVFVTVHGWQWTRQSKPQWAEIKLMAGEHGFNVEAG